MINLPALDMVFLRRGCVLAGAFVRALGVGLTE